MNTQNQTLTDSIQDAPGFPDKVTVTFYYTLIWSEPYVGPYESKGGKVISGITWNRELYTKQQNQSIAIHLDEFWNEYEQQICSAEGIEY